MVGVLRLQIRSTPWSTNIKVDAANPEDALQMAAELLPSLPFPVVDGKYDEHWVDGESFEQYTRPSVYVVWRPCSLVPPVYEPPEDAQVESLLKRVEDGEDRQLVRELLEAVKDFAGPFRIEAV
jgi:hypothetical protein